MSRKFKFDDEGKDTKQTCDDCFGDENCPQCGGEGFQYRGEYQENCSWCEGTGICWCIRKRKKR